jgi:hypothetical protein
MDPSLPTRSRFIVEWSSGDLSARVAAGGSPPLSRRSTGERAATGATEPVSASVVIRDMALAPDTDLAIESTARGDDAVEDADDDDRRRGVNRFLVRIRPSGLGGVWNDGPAPESSSGS